MHHFKSRYKFTCPNQHTWIAVMTENDCYTTMELDQNRSCPECGEDYENQPEEIIELTHMEREELAYREGVFYLNDNQS